MVHSFFNRCGGILADDMGLGKTLQTLATLSFLRSTGGVTGPFLVVAPLSCTGNWVREAKRFVPHLSVAKIAGLSRERQYLLEDDEIFYGMKDIIITTYETLVSTADFFQGHFWAAIVLDEAHRIKNTAGQAREVLDCLQCASRILLTGTPLQNNLKELFALLQFLWPDVLARESEVFESAVQMPDFGQATTRFREDPVAETKGTVDVPLLEKVRSLLNMLMLRRKKEDVISLPPKVSFDVWLPLSPLQVEWYRTLLRCRSLVQQRGLRALLKLLTRLRLLSGHPRCIVMQKGDREALLSLRGVDSRELDKLSTEPRMSEEVIKQSGKLAFLDKLLGHLHAQNMGFSETWRKAYEERQKSTQKQRKRSAQAWLKSTEGFQFLDAMRPWVSAEKSKGSSTGANAAAGSADPAAPKALQTRLPV